MNKLIAGLGNPGKKYQGTRHNAGFTVVDYVADEWGAGSFTGSNQADGLVTKVTLAGHTVRLVKSQNFMNKSGAVVRRLADYYQIAPKQILVIHDDLDLPIGQLRISANSSAGGHNGVRSVINSLGTQEFARLRLGIGPAVSTNDERKRLRDELDAKPYVLGQFTDEENEMLEELLPAIQEGVRLWITEGKQAAMNAVNG